MSSQSSTTEEINIAYLLARLWASKFVVIFFVLAITGLVYGFTQIATPKYASEAQVLIEAQETPFTRPEVQRTDTTRQIDERDVASQVQVLLSRDVAEQVIEQLGLRDDPRFDPALQGLSPIKALFVVLGLSEDPMRLSAQERVFQTFSEGLSVFNIPESRVIVVRYESEDPDLSAAIANALVQTYQAAQRAAQATNTRSASSFLEAEIADLRAQVNEAEAAVARFRSSAGLFLGPNETTLSQQQLSELSSERTRARADESEARSRAEEIRALIAQQGTQVALPDSFATPLTRRLQEEQAALRARIAELSATLLPQHPRLRELNAQRADLGGQLRAEAGRIAQRFDNEARVAAARATALEDELARESAEASRIAEAEVELRALEREAAAQRDLLASYLVRFREAATREDAALLPTDARVIQTAQIEREPIFPRTLPMVAIAFVGSFAIALFGVMSHAILAGAVREDDAPIHQREPVAMPLAVDVPLANESRSQTLTEASAPVPRPADTGPTDPWPSGDPIAPLQAVTPHMAMQRFRAFESGERQLAHEPATPQQARRQPAFEPVRSFALADPHDCRLLFAHIRRVSPSGAGVRVTVGAADTAAPAGEVALRLARAKAEAGRSTVFVDCVGDLKGTNLSPDGPGFFELVTGASGFDAALHRDRETPLHIIPSGFELADRSMIADDAADLVVSALAELYDSVIVNAGHDPQLLLECARINDCTVLCGDENKIAALAHTLSSLVPRERLLAVRFDGQPQTLDAIPA